MKSEESEGPTRMVIWTRGYRPFLCGGKVNYAFGCEAPCEGPFDLGRGYQGYVVTTPDGDTRVVEAETGAIVGDTIEETRQDVKDANPGVIERQMDMARTLCKEVEVMPADDFWEKMRSAK